MSIQAHRDNQSVLTELMSWMGAPALQPQVRLEEWVEDGRRVIRVDLPGVDPQRDIQLSVEDGVLHLRGERRAETHDQHRTEIRYGSFARVIDLPPGARAEDISADYADGVLTVSMPAGAPTSAQTIPVTSADSATSSGQRSAAE